MTTHRGPGRPPFDPEEVRQRAHLRLHPDTLRVLDELAEDAGETRTAAIERLIWEERERKPRRSA